MEKEELKRFIVDIIEEEFSPNPVEMASKWIDGVMVLKPSGDQQAKEIPLEVFFKKITGLREALRVLEQKLNNHPALPMEDKATFQGYLTKCYGSLTSFNILFKEGKDRFVGAGGKEAKEEEPKMTISEARKKIGLNEY